MNRYDTPAQAQFINTYVPLPFEQLYTLGREAKANVDKAMTDLSSTLDKWSDFRSPSAVDTQTWYDETIGKAQPVVEKLASNLDMLKTAEGRAQISSLINNVDRRKLSTLMQSKEGLEQRQKVNQQLMLSGKYNPMWHDVDFGNYNTLDEGTYNDISPLAYQSIKELTDPYVNNLKDSFIKQSGGYNYTGVTGENVRGILDANRSGILATPEAQKHMQVFMAQNPGSSAGEAASWFMQKAFIDNQEYIRENIAADPFALQSSRDAAIRARKGEEAQQPIPDIYERTLIDAKLAQQRLYNTPDIFNNTKALTSAVMQKRNEIQQELTVYQEALANGQITESQFNRQVKDLEKYAEASKEVKNQVARAYQDDIKDIFFKNTSIKMDAKITEPEDYIDYNRGASRTLSAIMSGSTGADMQAYNEGVSNGKNAIRSGDLIENGFVRGTSKGIRLAPSFVNKIAGVKGKQIEIEDETGRRRNFMKDIENGNYTGVLIVPRNEVTTITDEDGRDVLVQRMSVKIPLTAFRSNGYSKEEIDRIAVRYFGITPETGVQVKPASEAATEAAFGAPADTRGDIERLIPNFLGGKDAPVGFGGANTDTYYTFDAVEYIDPNSSARTGWSTAVDKQQGGTKSQSAYYGNRIDNTYEGALDY